MEYLRKLGGYFWKSDENEPATGEAPRPTPAARNTTEPLMRDVPGSQGSVQGLDWYKSSMQVDGDGDVAQEFFEERDSSRDHSVAIAPESKYQKVRPTLSKQSGGQPATEPMVLSVTSGKVQLS